MRCALVLFSSWIFLRNCSFSSCLRIFQFRFFKKIINIFVNYMIIYSFTFLHTRRLLQTEKRMICYSIQQHWYQVCSGNNVATPVTAMMVSLYQHWCLITDLYSSVLVYPIPTASISAVDPSCLSQPVLTQHTCWLYHSVVSDYIQPWQPNRLFQSDTVSSEQSLGDNSLIQLWYHTCIRPEGATDCNRSVAFLRFNERFTSEALKSSGMHSWDHTNDIYRCIYIYIHLYIDIDRYVQNFIT